MDLIKSRFRRRSPDESAVLEVLALAEPMPLEVLVQCGEREAISSLHEDSLLTISMDRDQIVSLSHPLYGEVIRKDVPAGRSLAIRRQVLKLMDRDSRSADSFLRYVAWGLDCGLPPDEKTLLKAAVVANRLYDPEFALRAARAVHTTDLRGNAMVEIARAQMMRGNLPYSREIVDEVLAGCSSLWLAKEATLLSVALRLRGKNAAEMIRSDAARWELIVEQLTSKNDGGRERSVSLLGCRVMESYALNFEGRFYEAEEKLQAILAAKHGSDELRLAALSLMGETLGSTGRALQGADCTREALQIIFSTGHTFVAHLEFVLARHFLCLAHAGEWDEIKALLEQRSLSGSGGMVHFGGMLELAEGLIALRKGFMRTARTRLILAVEGLRESDINQMMPLALGLAAFACAMVGDSTRARGYISDFAVDAGTGTKQACLLGEVHVTAANALFQGASKSIEELRRTADFAEEEKMPVVAAIALELSARLGDNRTFEQLAHITAPFEGKEGAILHAMAQGALDKDPDALQRAATLAEASQFLLLAAECLGKAVKLLGERSEEQKSRAVQQRLTTIVDQLEGLQSPQLADTGSASKLTQREQDISTLASKGYSNKDIAQQHGVSVRTVEGHLYRIFAKLGITRREELPGA